jgi:hypothetical protein
MNHCHESIQRHKNKRIDTGIRRNYDQILYNLAPDVSEGPEGKDVVGGSKGDAEDDEEEVSDSQVDDEQVGGAPHLLVGSHYQHNLERYHIKQFTNVFPLSTVCFKKSFTVLIAYINLSR